MRLKESFVLFCRFALYFGRWTKVSYFFVLFKDSLLYTLPPFRHRLRPKCSFLFILGIGHCMCTQTHAAETLLLPRPLFCLQRDAAAAVANRAAFRKHIKRTSEATEQNGSISCSFSYRAKMQGAKTISALAAISLLAGVSFGSDEEVVTLPNGSKLTGHTKYRRGLFSPTKHFNPI